MEQGEQQALRCPALCPGTPPTHHPPTPDLQVSARHDVRPRPLQVGLQQAHQRRYVAAALPEQRREQRREDGMVGLRHGGARRPHLQQLCVG